MKVFVLPILLIAAAAWAFFAYLVWFIPPVIEGSLVFSNLAYFFLSVGVAFGLTASLLLYFFGSFLLPKTRTLDATHFLKRLFIKSLRRGFLLSSLLVTIGALNVFNLLNLLNGVLVVGIAILIESYFSSR